MPEGSASCGFDSVISGSKGRNNEYDPLTASPVVQAFTRQKKQNPGRFHGRGLLSGRQTLVVRP